MFFHGTTSGRPRKIDFMAGSERMLKAHHKNAVFLKSLENKKSYYDSNCNKSLSRMQQEIYEVYFNEYMPLKEESTRIRQHLPRLSHRPPKLTKPAKLPGKEQRLVLPGINSTSTMSSFVNDKIKNQSTETLLDLLRTKRNEKEKLFSLHSVSMKYSSQTEHANNLERTTNMASVCSLWPGSMSDMSDSPLIDEKRLNIIKTAIALTSQPAKSPAPPRRPKRFRRSFLVNLRRESKIVWEDEMLAKVGGPFKKKESKVEPAEIKTEEQKKSSGWQPSLSKNKIFNDEDDGTESDDMVFEFVDRSSRGSIFSDISARELRKRSMIRDVPVHDMDRDLYHLDSSPDMFSVITEQSGSSYTDSSYTTGSDDSISDYSFYSEDD